MNEYIVTVVIAGGIPLLGLATSYGIMKARLNNHNKELGRLNDCKAEKAVVKCGFRAINEKLDLIIRLEKSNNKPKR